MACETESQQLDAAKATSMAGFYERIAAEDRRVALDATVDRYQKVKTGAAVVIGLAIGAAFTIPGAGAVAAGVIASAVLACDQADAAMQQAEGLVPEADAQIQAKEAAEDAADALLDLACDAYGACRAAETGTQGPAAPPAGAIEQAEAEADQKAAEAAEGTPAVEQGVREVESKLDEAEENLEEAEKLLEDLEDMERDRVEDPDELGAPDEDLVG